MTYTALIIEDDEGTAEEVAEIVESLGHTCESASCMESAKRRLSASCYDYVLLDLGIPVRSGRTMHRTENGINLLHHIRNTPTISATPVIIMTAHGNDGPEQAVELMRAGADDYLAKPFSRSRLRLDEIILRLLAKRGAPAQERTSLRPFEECELVFFPDRVELNGVKVCRGRGKTRSILETMRARRSVGCYRYFSAAQLAEAAEAKRGQQAAVEAISRFKKTVQSKMASERGIDCQSQDVIEHDQTYGYRFSSMITDRDAIEQDVPAPKMHDPANASARTGDDLGNGADDPVNDLATQARDPVNDPATGQRDLVKPTAKQRREWVLSELRRGTKLRRPDVEKQFGVSQKTATRDLQALMKERMIEFVGHGGTGHYRLARKRR